jgi:hypothetical protein
MLEHRRSWSGALAAGFVAFAVVASTLVKLATGGWGIVLFGVLYVVVLVAHIVSNVLAIARLRIAAHRAGGLGLIALSGLLLLGGFLLRWDFGDSPHGWLAATALVGRTWTATGRS